MAVYHNDSHVLAYIFYINISYVYGDLFNGIFFIKYAFLINVSNIEHTI